MSRRGFSLVELAIVLSIVAIITPILWHRVAAYEAETTLALWTENLATEVATVEATLQVDAAAGEPTGPLSWTVEGCAVEWRVEAGDLVRAAEPACGGRQVLAHHAAKVERVPGGIDVLFERRLSPTQTVSEPVLFPVEGP